MKVCITGANGFVGKFLLEKARLEFEEIKILSRKKLAETDPKIMAIQGDLTSEDCPLEKFLDGCDIVFHCAGEIKNTDLMRKLHVDGTKKLLEAVEKEAQLKNKKIHFVHLSSVGVYGKPALGANQERVITEDSPIKPVGEYEITKYLSDELVLKKNDSPWMTYSILRPSNIFGPKMPNQSLFKLASMIKKGLFFYIGKPKAIATYVHVEDVVVALLLCAKSHEAKNQIFNLSNDCLFEEMISSMALAVGKTPPAIRFRESSVRNLVKVFGKFMPLPLNQERIDALVLRTCYPNSKIESVLGFKPKRSVQESIVSVIKENFS